jgi:hypothetical protein
MLINLCGLVPHFVALRLLLDNALGLGEPLPLGGLSRFGDLVVGEFRSFFWMEDKVPASPVAAHTGERATESGSIQVYLVTQKTYCIFLPIPMPS